MKNTLFILGLLIPVLSNAQMTREQAKAMVYQTPTLEEERKTHPNACHFYKTAADYYADKPLENVDWRPYSYTMLAGTEKLEVINNGKTDKVKFAELPADWVTDESGVLMRRYNGKLYSVVVDGPLSYYVQFKNGDAYKANNGQWIFGLSSEDKFFDFYSETLNGEIKKMDDKVLEKYLETYNLSQQYKADKPKREMKDTVNGYKSKQVNRDVKYIGLINEQLAKK